MCKYSTVSSAVQHTTSSYLHISQSIYLHFCLKMSNLVTRNDLLIQCGIKLLVGMLPGIYISTYIHTVYRL